MRAARAAMLLLWAASCWAGSAPIPDAARYTYRERPGSVLPMQSELVDSNGESVRLADLPRGMPLILVFGYFRCSSLCGVVRSSLLNALSGAHLRAGRDYTLAVVSIDPADTSSEARDAKAADLGAFAAQPPEAPYLHYLTGRPQVVAALAGAAGFRDRYDGPTRQFVHPAGVVFSTEAGMVSGYLLGVGYTPAAVRSAVERAAAGRIAAVASPLLLICFHFDPNTGRYSLEVLKVLRLAGLLTVVTLGGVLFLLFRRERVRS